MSPREQRFKKSYAYELVRLAEADLYAAGVLMKGKGVRPETTLYLIQQSIEKALKAVLCWREISVPKTRDLYAIVQKLEPRLPPGEYDLHDLTLYATIRRYEEGEVEISTDDLQLSHDSTKLVIEWAKRECSDAS